MKHSTSYSQAMASASDLTTGSLTALSRGWTVRTPPEFTEVSVENKITDLGVNCKQGDSRERAGQGGSREQALTDHMCLQPQDSSSGEDLG